MSSIYRGFDAVNNDLFCFYGAFTLLSKFAG
jgi:hypothetical protein